MCRMRKQRQQEQQQQQQGQFGFVTKNTAALCTDLFFWVEDCLAISNLVQVALYRIHSSWSLSTINTVNIRDLKDIWKTIPGVHVTNHKTEVLYLASVCFYVWLAFEDSLRKTIKDGNFDKISAQLTPRDLTKCSTNALLMAMEVFTLHSFHEFEKR